MATLARRRAEAELEGRVPGAVRWSTEEVAHWITTVGFPHYQDCFRDNFISGRKLIFMDMSTLPKIGITDFEDLKVICKAIRDLLKLEDPDYNRSVSLPPRDAIGLYLERKSQSGKNADRLTYSDFLRDYKKLNIVYDDK